MDGNNTLSFMIGLFNLINFIIIPIILFFVEYILAKKASKFAIILPTMALFISIFLGAFYILISAIMFLIWHLVKKSAEKKLSEIDKMNIQDLD
jgi:hypothetical protein